jgi:hypothetical protein
MSKVLGQSDEADTLRVQQLKNIGNHLISQQNMPYRAEGDIRADDTTKGEASRGCSGLRGEDRPAQATEEQWTSAQKSLEGRTNSSDQTQPVQNTEEMQKEAPSKRKVSSTEEHDSEERVKKRRHCSTSRNDGEEQPQEQQSRKHNNIKSIIEKDWRKRNEQLDVKLDDTVASTSSMRLPTPERDAAKTSDSSTSSPQNIISSHTAKRTITVVDTNSMENVRKKQRLSHTSIPTPDSTEDESSSPQRCNKPTHKLNYCPPCNFAPVVHNPECKHAYVPYDDDSIPILHAAHIQRKRSPVLLNNPSVDLKIKALARLERAGGFSAEELGRPDVRKKGPTKTIDDVDLYLTIDGKVHIATESGLLLAAHYLKLAGIPDHTPVRFHGNRPLWIKSSIARRFARRIETTTEDPNMPEWENPFAPLPPGDLGLMFGRVVQVYERHPTDGRAYGRRLDNNRVGWFDWNHTTHIHAPYPVWEGLFTPEQLALKARTPVAPATPQPRSSKTVSCAPVVSGRLQTPTTQLSNSCLKTSILGTVSTKKHGAGTQAPCDAVQTLGEQRGISTMSKEASATSTKSLQSEIVVDGVLSRSVKIAATTPVNSKAKEVSFEVKDHPDSVKKLPEDKDKESEAGPRKVPLDEIASTTKHTNFVTEEHSPPGQEASYVGVVEDEVDWDDDEL